MSVVRKTVPLGVPLRVSREHPVPMWRSSYLSKATRFEQIDWVREMIRMVDPSETLWAVEEGVQTIRGEDFVLVLSPGGVGWMAADHLTA